MHLGFEKGNVGSGMMPSTLNRRWMFIALFLFAFLRGALYASFLPPWGLVDEEQHFDYIKRLAEYQTVPIANQTFLSPEVIASLFETKRWEKFHWQTPRSSNPLDLGLEGYSYEGYQPPLFYLANVPLYLALPDSILLKLYGLRLAMVLASLLTIWIAIRLSEDFFPGVPLLPYVVGLVLSVIPERTMATSRLNNDVLLEVLGALLAWISVQTVLHGITAQRARLLGVVLGLGMLTKVSIVAFVIALVFVYWLRRQDGDWIRNLLWTLGLAIIITAPSVIYNLQIYGDWSGFRAFQQLNESFKVFQHPPLSCVTLVTAWWDLFRHFWVIWWHGALPGFNPVLLVPYFTTFLVSVIAVAGLVKYLHKARHYQFEKRVWSLWLFITLIIAYAVLVVKGFFDGMFPVIQGRFLLPVIVPIIIMLVWGVWQFPQRFIMSSALLGVLVLVDGIYLFGKLVPYFYYWSAFFKEASPLPYAWTGWQSAWNIFLPRLLGDKPEGMGVVLLILVIAYILLLIIMTWIWGILHNASNSAITQPGLD